MHLNRLSLVFATLVAGGGAAGCTLVGVAVGAIVDSGTKLVTIPTAAAGDLEDGTSVLVVLHNGTVLKGRLAGRTQQTDAILVNRSGRQDRVPLADIAMVQLPPHKGGVKAGAITGAIIDVFVVFLRATCCD